ncbi:MAG: DEAD/DEAH box helicase [Oscillospiraceae bacterium]
MSEVLFSTMDIIPEIKKVLEELQFEHPTEIQEQAIPVIKTGADVIGKSQTGTGKTIAFAIPALEVIANAEDKSSLQVLIVCPTRELASQAYKEIKNLAQYMHSVKVAEIYGGVPMDRQIIKLKRANIVIGTPGRIMDHMRRRTLKVNNLKMIVLDEADEMLSMGFKEDIETILMDTPEDRQTVLFSATMPKEIMQLTKEFQKEPQLIQINKQQVTVNNISQSYIQSPMGRKMDILNLLLRFYNPNRAMIFCNTKKMVDDVTEYLHQNNFLAEGLHGDMKQSQRSSVMDLFKAGRVNVLVATDVAARGIDVNDIDYVINYDIPQNNEYYVHRIGRTGRAGKNGCAITITSGRRQMFIMRDIAKSTKSEIKEIDIPTTSDIKEKSKNTNLEQFKNAMQSEIQSEFLAMVDTLVTEGYSLKDIAAKALELNYISSELSIQDVKAMGKKGNDKDFANICIDIGRASRVAPNHIVGAITERYEMSGSQIGKIEIYDDKTLVAVPKNIREDIVEAMIGCKICGKPTITISVDKVEKSNNDNGFKKSRRDADRGRSFKNNKGEKSSYNSENKKPKFYDGKKDGFKGRDKKFSSFSKKKKSSDF